MSVEPESPIPDFLYSQLRKHKRMDVLNPSDCERVSVIKCKSMSGGVSVRGWAPFSGDASGGRYWHDASSDIRYKRATFSGTIRQLGWAHPRNNPPENPCVGPCDGITQISYSGEYFWEYDPATNRYSIEGDGERKKWDSEGCDELSEEPDETLDLPPPPFGGVFYRFSDFAITAPVFPDGGDIASEVPTVDGCFSLSIGQTYIYYGVASGQFSIRLWDPDSLYDAMKRERRLRDCEPIPCPPDRWETGCTECYNSPPTPMGCLGYTCHAGVRFCCEARNQGWVNKGERGIDYQNITIVRFTVGVKCNLGGTVEVTIHTYTNPANYDPENPNTYTTEIREYIIDPASLGEDAVTCVIDELAPESNRYQVIYSHRIL